jgi:hypothetical protein
LPFDDEEAGEGEEEEEKAERNCEGNLRRDAKTLLEGETEEAAVAVLEGRGAALLEEEEEEEEEALDGPALFALLAEGMAGYKLTSGPVSLPPLVSSQVNHQSLVEIQDLEDAVDK